MKTRLLVAGVVLLVLGAAAVPVVRLLRSGGNEVPTVRVMRGDLDLSVHTNGELRPGRSAMVVAPSVPGTLQIVRLAVSGTATKAGDVVVDFDPSEQEFNLEQSRSELEQADQELVRAKADTEVLGAQDQVAILKARFAVRRAELDLAARDLLGAIQARKNELALEEAERRLAQLQQDLSSKGTRSRGALAVLEARRDKARLAMTVAQQNIDNMAVRAPIDGIVVLKQNMDASGGMFFSGMALPDYRTGDMVGAGRLIAEILDPNGLELMAKINEADRANLNAGQAAEVSVDGLPGGVFPASIKAISGTAARGFFFDNDSRRKFDATLQITKTDGRLRPGLSADVVISGQQLKGVLYVPRQALFEKGGKPVVYARGAGGFDARPVKVKYKSESRAVIEGIDQGTEVALVDPDAQSAAGRKPAGPASPGGPGGRK